ncbi:mannonate dehydratase [Cognatishimia activa]|uniref:mannonate dehydratase n=1 Tax=Cognatishimia activa TaxID=1715691 RepID=UPI002230A7D7|nr:mannonate dehydratase [Cognatishimia activa]UZD92551.1 mannonate dehydratase [Cognatishimia activa]
MRQTWRWFGPADTVNISDLPQVGVEGVVSALHHIENGTIWSLEEIEKRKLEIERLPNGAASGVTWDVVESLPVSEVIKTKGSDYKSHIENYCTSLEHLASAGLYTICYNFMPVLDWTRTNLRAPMPTGASAMLFDLVDFIAFDLFILKRPGGEADYSSDIVFDAERRFAQMDDAAKLALQQNIVAGLPGANDGWTAEEIRDHLATYARMTRDVLRQNLVDFLSEVIPTAERLGIRMCCHPDDPPFSLLGLPRIMSSEADYAAVMQAVDSHSNGITLCTGSLGVNPDFDGPGFVERLGDRIHFAHLRNTSRIAPADGSRTSFYEAEHLAGDTDMVGTVKALMAEQSRRKTEGRADWQIPMRPDHGQDLLHDQVQESMPGYPLIGRMRGLAELRGVMAAVSN